MEKYFEIIKSLQDKDIKIYMFIGNNNVINEQNFYLYSLAAALKKAEYDLTLLYDETPKSIIETLGEGYKFKELSLKELSTSGVAIKPTDIFLVPEYHLTFAKELNRNKLPSLTIVISQNQNEIYKHLNLREKWTNSEYYGNPAVGAEGVICASQTLSSFVINEQNINTHVFKAPIVSKTTVSLTNKKPHIAIYCKNKDEYAKIINMFYNKNPQYGWITFRQVVNFENQALIPTLTDSICLVYVDITDTNAILPLTAMLYKTPTIGVIPELANEYLTADNGFWVENIHNLIPVLTYFVEEWLTDKIYTNHPILEEMDKTLLSYSDDNVVPIIDDFINARIEKIKTIIEKQNPDANSTILQKA